MLAVLARAQLQVAVPVFTAARSGQVEQSEFVLSLIHQCPQSVGLAGRGTHAATGGAEKSYLDTDDGLC